MKKQDQMDKDTQKTMIQMFPEMLTGDALREKLLYLPEYSRDICTADAGRRLMELNNLSQIYLPSQMTEEIYCKLYLAMIRAMEKKQTPDSVRQNNENRKRIMGLPSASILGGSDSFSITGPSGIGKSTAIMKAVELAGGGTVMEFSNPYQKIVPCVAVQCPHDCSVKGLLLSILRAVDHLVGTNYEERAVHNRSTIDTLIGVVSQVAVNHILLIVIDECQNICRNAYGVNLVSCLTQLINSSGISICLVGLPETEEYFQREMHLARRSIGLSYKPMAFNEEFLAFCHTLYAYQYVAHPSELIPEMSELLYQLSGGVIGIVLSLFMEAQQVAILNETEELTREIITETFEKRFRNLRDYVPAESGKQPQTAVRRKRKRKEESQETLDETEDCVTETTSEELAECEEEEIELIRALKNKGIIIEEVSA